jgi:predicted transcriptional regulator
MDQNPTLQIMQMSMGGVVAQSISAAAELGVADLLHERRRDTRELAAATGAQADKLHRLLRFLASIGIFELGTDGLWGLTPLANVLRSDVPGSMRAGARMLGRTSPAVARLLDNVRTGTCAYTLAFGKPIFEDLGGRPEDAAIFDAAMNSIHGPETPAVLDAYPYADVSVLADIGCGSGAVMIETLKRHPAMRGILYDQAHVMARTAQNVQAAGLGDRCTMASGNFFESIPAGADAYSMRHILHDWQDDQCIGILRNIRRVIPSSGRLLVIETVVPDGNDPSPSKLFDVVMMMFPDGLERSEAQFQSIFNASGFKLTGIKPTESPVSVIEARPV